MSALLVASLLAASAAPSFTPVSADPAAESTVLQRIHAAASKALVQVGPDPRHAGVLITESGVLLAPSAGLQVAQVVPVTFVNGFHAEADVVALDAELGVALLRLRLTVPVAFVPMGSAAPQPTQASYLLHFGRPQTASVTFARIATTRVARAGHIDERFLTAHYGLDARSRGGAVISYAGQLIGLLLTSDTSGTGFAVSTRALLNFVGQHAEVLPGVALTTTSDPSGAQLFLDGALQGNTPLSLPRIPMGEHLLALRTPGLPDTVRTFEAFGSSTQALSFVLLPGAPVTLEAPAAAELRVDGVLRANGPATLWLPGGRHVVQATQPGHRPFSRVIEVVEDRPLVLAVTMVEARATLTVDTVPPGAAVMLDDNRIGETPLLARRVSPGTYELTLARTGFHPLKIPVSIPDGQDVNLGKLALEAPHGTLVVRAPPGTEVSLDGGPRHPLRASERFAPGEHRATFFAPYQYALISDFRAEDGQTVTLAPTFVAAGSPQGRAVAHTVSSIVEGGAGVLSLVSTGFFIAAESDRSSNNGVLSQSGHGTVSVGLVTAGLGLGLYGASLFIDSLQATPDMGHDATAAGQRVSMAPKPAHP
jgi:hypothetical protein